LGRPDTYQLAETLRGIAPAVAAEVTDQFLDCHPDWRTRFGSRAVTHGVQDAQYHIAFLAAAIEAGNVAPFAAYARWTAGVLAARDMASSFLAENLAQVRDAVAARLGPDHAAVLAPYFTEALAALDAEPPLPAGVPLDLTATMFLQAILSGQRAAAVEVAREALRDGTPLQSLYLDVFQPALYEVGARWEANDLTVAQEHIATAITQFVMAQIYEPPRQQSTRGTVLLTGVEGELHNIGAVMVGDLLETSGWNVRFLGTNLPATAILSAIRDTAPTYVGISTTMLFNVAAARELIRAIRREFGNRLRIIVGGAAFRSNPELWQQVAADAFAPDLRGVQALLAQP
jgi:methanogenic corrinoid protein MtbC1